MLDALRVANTVAHGIHGRRRAGTGETFWQFRQFQASDPATVIDWRRSASSDHLYVREREWEAAHTFWLWPDISPSMDFQQPPVAGHQARPRAGADAGRRRAAGARRRAHRAARPHAADGEPQGHLAHRRDAGRASRATRRCRRACRRRRGLAASPARCCSAISSIRPRSSPPASTRWRRAASPATSCRCSIPPRRRWPTRAAWSSARPKAASAGSPTASRPCAPQYQKKLAAHRASIEEATRRIGWSFLVHHTDRPAAEPLLTLIMRLQGMAGDYRWKPEAHGAPAGGAP